MTYSEALNGMNITLCDYKSERLWASVCARIENGMLRVEGQDLGDVPLEWFGSDEYEYFYDFDLSNTEKLLQTLAEGKKDPVEELRRRFSGMNGCNALTAFCEEHGIQYRRSSWISHL